MRYWIIFLLLLTGCVRSGYELEFIDEQGNQINGEVTLNDRLLGMTHNGAITLQSFEPGNGSIMLIHNSQIVSYSISIENKDRIYGGITFTINLSETKTSYDEYFSAVDRNNQELRVLATTITADCPSGNKACQTVALYTNVSRTVRYYSDPREGEHIQNPFQTLHIKGGDCEDMTILLMSLLENLGIKTYFAFTNDHAYAAVCDLDKDEVLAYTTEVFTEIRDYTLSDDTIYLEPEQISYGGPYENPLGEDMVIEFTLVADRPVDFYLVPSEQEVNKFLLREEFDYYTFCSHQQVLDITQICPLPQGSSYMIANDYGYSNIITRKIQLSYLASDINLSEIVINTLTLDNQSCMIIDPTLGAYGYVGQDNEIKESARYFDPITTEEVYSI